MNADWMLKGGLLMAALACAALMGLAIQRGATCTVAAVDELINQRRATRLVAILESALWVLGGLLLAPHVLPMPRMPAAFDVTMATLAGGVLLGIGAFVNRACVFGTLARLGCGEWGYALTPVGYLLGCAMFQAAGWMASARLARPSPVLQASAWFLVPVLTIMTLRVAKLLRQGVRRPDAGAPTAALASASWWTPHSATLVIGITFVLMFLIAGPWAYTDVLAEWAARFHGGPAGAAPGVMTRFSLMGALFGGAILGGWSARRFSSVPVSVSGVTRCLTGGALMGMGAALIPGGNDGLVLMGLPLLWPYAWTAFLTMGVAIALAMVARQRWPVVLGWI